MNLTGALLAPFFRIGIDVGRCGITLPGWLRRLVVTEERAGTNRWADGIFVLIRVVVGCCMAYGHSSSSIFVCLFVCSQTPEAVEASPY